MLQNCKTKSMANIFGGRAGVVWASFVRRLGGQILFVRMRCRGSNGRCLGLVCESFWIRMRFRGSFWCRFDPHFHLRRGPAITYLCGCVCACVVWCGAEESPTNVFVAVRCIFAGCILPWRLNVRSKTTKSYLDVVISVSR